LNRFRFCGPFNSNSEPYWHNARNRIDRSDRWLLHYNATSFCSNIDTGMHNSGPPNIKPEWKEKTFRLSFVIGLHAGCGVDRIKGNTLDFNLNFILFYFCFCQFQEEILRTPAKTLPLLAFYYAVSFINEPKLPSISRTPQHPRAIQCFLPTLRLVWFNTLLVSEDKTNIHFNMVELWS
jgi:hypothetical protein